MEAENEYGMVKVGQSQWAWCVDGSKLSVADNVTSRIIALDG